MSPIATTTTNHPTDAAAAPPDSAGALSSSVWGAVLASEWTKLRSVRSTVWTLLATFVVTIVVGSLVALTRASGWDTMTIRDQLAFDPTNFSLRGVLPAQLAIGVLGVLVMSAEYSSGLIRTTFVAVPRRRVVLYSKAMVFAACAYLTTAVACLIAFLIGQAIFARKRLPTGATLGVSLSSPGAVRSVLLAAFYLTAVGIIGLSLGSLVRRTAGAIAALFGVIFVLPILTSALPSPWDSDVGKYLPSGAGAATFMVKHTNDRLGALGQLNPAAGVAVLVGYLILALWLAGIALTRRDA